MSAPVINPTTSIQEWRQYQTWEYQPFVSGVAGTPTWTCTGLPAGMTCDSSTGKISGAATVPGVFEATLGMTDSVNGDATPIVFPVYIEAANGALHSGADVGIDLQSGDVTLDGQKAPQGADGKPGPLFSVKRGDGLMLYVRFLRNGVVVDLGAIASMRFGMKVYDSDAVVALGGGTDTTSDDTPFHPGADATYILYVAFTSDDVSSALSDNEGDKVTAVLAACELTWEEPNPTSSPRIGPATVTRTTRPFFVEVIRDEIAE